MALTLKSSSSRLATAGKRSSARPSVRGPVRKLAVVRASAEPSTPETNEYVVKAQKLANDALDWTKAKWEATEDSEKPAVIAIIVGVIVAQIAIGATIDVVDKIPIVNKGLQLLGLGVTGYFAFKIISDPDERQTVKDSIGGFVNKVTGDDK